MTPILVTIVFSLLALAVSLTRPRVMFYIVVFLAPWSGVAVDVGVRLTAFRIAMAMLTVATLVRLPLSKPRRSELPISPWLAVFFAYAVGRSLAAIASLPDAEVIGGPLRSPLMRSGIQLFMLGLKVSPVLVAPLILRGVGEVRETAKVYVVSTVLLASLGWFQLAFWYGTGWNPLPVGVIDSLYGREASLADPADTYEGIARYRGFNVYRMNSLGGEPKNLGQGLAVALLLLQLAMVQWRGNHNTIWTLTWLFLYASMLMTLSTSGLVLWLVGTIALGALRLIATNQNRKEQGFIRWLISSVGAPAFTLVLLALLVTSMSSLGVVDYLQVLEERTLGRTYIEDFDGAIMRFLGDQPRHIWLGVGLGNAHLYANDYLSVYARYAFDTAFAAKSGYLRLVSEVGIVGLFLFLGWIIDQIRRLQKQNESCRDHDVDEVTTRVATSLTQFGIVMTFLYLARGEYVATQTFLTLGLVVATTSALGRATHLTSASSTTFLDATKAMSVVDPS